MGRKLPPLAAIRAFEAAARHSSFSKAAEELFVTHAAVSRQIRSLEQSLGTRLFVRQGRGVVPTEAAVAYQATLTRLLDELEAATRQVAAVQSYRLRIRVDPALASRWLVPRLGRFQALHPEVELGLEPTYEVFDPRRGADIGIEFVDHNDTLPEDAEVLISVSAFPVASPGYLRNRCIDHPSALREHTLLHEESRSWWAEWLGQVGESAGGLKGPFFDETHLALLAAEGGQGIALGDDALVHDALAAGRLARVLPHSAPSGHYCVRSRRDAPAAVVGAFIDWVRRAGAEFDDDALDGS